MRKLAWCAPLLLVLLAAPFAVAAFLATAQAPAAMELTAAQCAAPGAGVDAAAGAGPGALAGATAGGPWRAPFAQAYVRNSGFGQRFDPAYRRAQLHAGQDLASVPRPGPVLAAAAGTITWADPAGGLGNEVEIDHGGAVGRGGVRTVYGHLASIDPAITPGAVVRTGQRLGVEGSTGASTGDHLHFEVHVGGRPVDPVPFMAARGAPLNGAAVPVPPAATRATIAVTAGMPAARLAPHRATGADPVGVVQEGGIGFDLPGPGAPRLNSLSNPPLPIPADVKAAYLGAAARYRVPWALLAGIGMEETGHGRTTATSSAGAQGLMQFMPATWAVYGVDGDGDGVAQIGDAADSAFSAANYLTASGVSRGAGGVRAAIFTYNHADWYVNDVLAYAAAYGGGTVLGDPTTCPQAGGAGVGDPTLPPVSPDRVTAVLGWAGSHVGDAYVMGAAGPHAWDCSSFTQAAYRRVGVDLPRTAGAQRDWLAGGHGYLVPAGQERPGDLVFTDSYLGPNQIGHVQLVWDPAAATTVEAQGLATGVVHAGYGARGRHIFQIWRVGSPR